MTINYLAVLVAAVLSWIAGAGWYGALGKHWMAALGWRQEDLPRSMPIGPMVTSFIAEVVMAVVLSGLIAHFGGSGLKTGLISAGFCWVGFVATTIAVNNAFQKRSTTLTFIDSGHWLVVLLIQGAVLGLMA
jgi:hypothetical protein